MPALSAWTNFYVIMGSASGALTGLMFVVVTLIAGARARGINQGVAAFSTPAVVHFCTVLLVSAILSAPWPVLSPIVVLLGLTGVAGVGYAIVVMRRVLRQDVYKLVLEDWLWHVLFPFVAYAVLVAAAIVLASNPTPALFGIGAVIVLLLFIGIHNAWDNLTYIAAVHLHQPGAESEREEG